MILTCPECATRYQTDAAQFPPAGRNVRCAKCGHVWHQKAPPQEPEARIDPVEPDAETQSDYSTPPSAVRHTAYAPQPMAARAAEPLPRPRGEGIAIAAGWIGLALIVMAVGWSAIRFREVIASAWPQSASFYSAVGLKVNTRGLDIRDVTSQRSHDNGQTVLAIRGRLVNITTHDVIVPRLLVRLVDGDQHVLDSWTFTAGAGSLKPGQTVSFATRRTDPPEDAHNLEVSFAEAGG